MMGKICRICGDLKSIDDFHIKRGTPDDHRNECKECVKNIQKKYKEEPGFKEKEKEYDKKRYQELKDETIQRMRQYRIDNKEEVNEKARERRKLPHVKKRYTEYNIKYMKEHKEELKKYRENNKELWRTISERYRENNPHIVAWRNMLYSTLKRLGTKKEGHTIDELGYSAQDLKKHLNSQFTTNMSWNNYGDWHIDHIRPVIDFPLNTPVKVVCALSNLKPMWSTTREIDGVIYEGNLNKSSRVDI